MEGDKILFAHVQVKSGKVANLTIISSLPDDHACYTAIGRIAALAASIERSLEECAASMAELGHRLTTCFFGQMIGPKARFNVIFQLAHEKSLPPEIIKRINSLSSDAGETFSRRNRVVHDAWGLDSETGTTYQFRNRAQNNTYYGLRVVSIEYLNETISELKSLALNVEGLTHEILAAMHLPSQQTP